VSGIIYYRALQIPEPIAPKLLIRQNLCGEIFIATFVKEYSNFDPKKQGVMVTKESFGQKNGDFCGFR